MLFNVFKKPIPDKVSEVMDAAIQDISRSQDKRAALIKTYDLVGSKYKGYRLVTYLMVFELVTNTLQNVWQRSGYLHCTVLNYLVRVLLVKSGHFKEEDIKQRWTLVYYFSPHQYLRVRLSESEVVDVDLWGKRYGVPFGQHACGFKLSPFIKTL